MPAYKQTGRQSGKQAGRQAGGQASRLLQADKNTFIESRKESAAHLCFIVPTDAPEPITPGATTSPSVANSENLSRAGQAVRAAGHKSSALCSDGLSRELFGHFHMQA